MLDELQILLRQAGTFFYDETALTDVTVKGRANFVTRCDTGIQNFLQRELAYRWPRIQFLGEENSNKITYTNAPTFVLDPVDGTANLMHHFGHSAISLALVENGVSSLAIVYDPFREEMFTAQKGLGAFCNGKHLHVSDAPNLAHSIVSIGTSPYDRQYADGNFTLFHKIFNHCEDLRRTGSAALDLAYVAAGRVEAYMERNLKPWDFAAGMLLVSESGGCISDYQGNYPFPLENADIIAATPNVFHELSHLLK